MWAGLAEVAHQRAVIARVQPAQAGDLAAVARGRAVASAPYDIQHLTWDPPAPLAFAAIGQRDVAPYMLRIRALSLEGQLYEGETYNAQLELAGRFDVAFVLTYLLPLFVVVRFHDLRAGEREAGRDGLLRSVASSEWRLWARRRLVRATALFVAVGAPIVVGALRSRVPPGDVGRVLAVTAAYLAFWVLAAAVVECGGRRPVTNAGALAAAWLVLTLVLPAAAYVAVNAAIPVAQGVELTLAHRQLVHAAWETPRETTMAAFYRTHPEWAGSGPPTGFDDKWYFAFHEVADERVAGAARAYRDGLLARDRRTARLGVVLPAVGVQVLLTRWARTDLRAQLAYQARVRAYHARLRRFYYRYLFTGTPFGAEDVARVPRRER